MKKFLSWLLIAALALGMIGTATADTVTITGCSDSVAFFKLDYDGVASEDIKVVFRAPVTIESALYLRGEDNVLYKITVNAGVISATAQTE